MNVWYIQQSLGQQKMDILPKKGFVAGRVLTKEPGDQALNSIQTLINPGIYFGQNQVNLLWLHQI